MDLTKVYKPMGLTASHTNFCTDFCISILFLFDDELPQFFNVLKYNILGNMQIEDESHMCPTSKKMHPRMGCHVAEPSHAG
jgi:hypothetical protein